MIASPTDPASKLTDWRCAHCHQLLARQGLIKGRLEIKCRKCETMNVLDAQDGTVREVRDS